MKIRGQQTWGESQLNYIPSVSAEPPSSQHSDTLSITEINLEWAYPPRQAPTCQPSSSQNTRTEQNGKGWDMMLILGYQPGKGLGKQSQGIRKPITPKAFKDGRGATRYRSAKKPATEAPKWTLQDHFKIGGIQQESSTQKGTARLDSVNLM